MARAHGLVSQLMHYQNHKEADKASKGNKTLYLSSSTQSSFLSHDTAPAKVHLIAEQGSRGRSAAGSESNSAVSASSGSKCIHSLKQ